LPQQTVLNIQNCRSLRTVKVIIIQTLKVSETFRVLLDWHQYSRGELICQRLFAGWCAHLRDEAVGRPGTGETHIYSLFSLDLL